MRGRCKELKKQREKKVTYKLLHVGERRTKIINMIREKNTKDKDFRLQRKGATEEDTRNRNKRKVR